jgi:DNA replication and repair protein RecF
MITDLSLTGFRSYTQADFSLAPRTLFLGENGQGKTNILEALYMLSTTTSWRALHDKDVINHQSAVARIVAGDTDMALQREPYLKRIRVDGVSKRAREVLGMRPVVLFHPDDVQLIGGSPSLRRSYLDHILAQVDRQYAEHLTVLSKVLPQRNRLLKQVAERLAGESELQYWDEQFVAAALPIQERRAELVRWLAEASVSVIQELLGYSVEIQYKQSSLQKGDLIGLAGLRSRRTAELAAGVTLVGPQRDDLLLSWKGIPLVSVFSRGQLRGMVAALKIVEMQYLAQHGAQSPLLLLDDILSELDPRRRELLLQVIPDNVQTIITSCDEVRDTRNFEVITLS